MRKTKKLLALLLILAMSVTVFAACGKKTAVTGTWIIDDLEIEPQYRFATSRNDTINDIAEAFPEIDSIVEFTTDKYGDGYKLISSSNIISYSVMENKISIGSAVGTYELNEDEIIIEFEDIATVYLSKAYPED